MSIITISRGSYSFGKETAEKLAEKLGYECLSREILLEASDQFGVPEIKLMHAIHDSFGFLDRFTHGKEKYIAYIRAALLTHLQKDNMVYHGLAGHFFLQKIPHVLKVRIMADLDSRVKIVRERDGISHEQALHILKKDDEARQKWSHELYGIDTQNPLLYDMVLHIGKMSVDDAVEILYHTARQPFLQATPGSRQKMDDLVLEARIEAALVNEFPTIRASADSGNVSVYVKGPIDETQAIAAQVESVIQPMADVKTVNVKVSAFTLDVKY